MRARGKQQKTEEVSEQVQAPRQVQDAGMRVVWLSSLELTYRASTKDEEALKRRFMTLSVPSRPELSWRGGVGYVVKAKSLATGEAFALKRLREHVGLQADGDEADERAKKLAASFRQEYDTHRLLSPTGLVPEIYGWATMDGEPGILMEWVEGLTLDDAAKELRGTDGKVPLATVADIGISVLAALQRIAAVDPTLVHRDLSPRNIMIRTGERSLSEQAESGMYDICLIDFGSATVEQGAGSSLTVAESVWRGATPDYAPPEMLAHDLEGLVELRRSSSIDVYALCSVLYELYAGHTPYDIEKRAERVPYQVKSTEPPHSLERREGDEGGVLSEAILAGLAKSQAARPSVGELSGELRAWEGAHGTIRLWEQTLSAQIASDAASIPKTTAPASPTVLRAKPMTATAGLGTGRPAPSRARSQKRRQFAAAVCAVAVIVVLLAVGVQTKWFAIAEPTPKDSVNEYTWDELSRIAEQIESAPDGNEAARIEAEYHLVNGEGKLDFTQTKDVTLSDGKQARVVITGFRHDEKSDGSGLTGISFSFMEPVAERPMNIEKTTTRDWSGTDLRAWLSGDFEQKLPDDLASSIIEVKKKSIVLVPAEDGDIDGFDDKGREVSYDVSTEETEDRLWVYSSAELGRLEYGSELADALGLSGDELGTLPYDAFSQAVNTEANGANMAELSNAGKDDSDDGSWLRTPSYDCSTGYLTTLGGMGSTCTGKLGVTPGFSI